MRINRRMLLSGILVVMAMMQIGLALRHSLWSDEVFSLAMATGHSLEHPAASANPALGDFVESAGPVSAVELRRYAEFESVPAGPRQVLRAVKLSDTSPPLYYLLLHIWTRSFGTSDLALRLFSILASLACVPLIVALGREIEDERAGWIAAGLFAMAPLSIYYSAEGRMYSLLWLAVVATAHATLRLYRSGADFRWHSWWVICAAGGLLIHYYFVFPLCAMGLFLLCAPGSDKRLWLIARSVAVIAGVMPWYWNFKDTLSQWRITQHWVEWKPEGYSRLIVLRDLFLQYFTGNGHYLWDAHRRAEMLALSVFVAIGFAALWRWRTKFLQGPRLLPLLWFAAACLGPFVADVARHTFIAEYPRYSSTALPAACLLGGVLLAGLHSRAAWTCLLLIAIGWAPSVASIYQSRSRSDQPMRDVARHISAYGSADDLVLVHSIPSGVIGVARYVTTPGAFATWIGQLGNRRVPESLPLLLAGRRRVILVKVHTVGEPAPEETWLREHANVVKEKRLAGAYITEFSPREGAHF